MQVQPKKKKKTKGKDKDKEEKEREKHAVRLEVMSSEEEKERAAQQFVDSFPGREGEREREGRSGSHSSHEVESKHASGRGGNGGGGGATVSPAFAIAVEQFLSANGNEMMAEEERASFRDMAYSKFRDSLAQPGEAVGVLAAQSIGEPSTQMT